MPPEVLERDGSTRKKRSNTLGSASAGMPTPVSETSMRIAAPSSVAASVTVPPGGVCAMAFETRLLTARSISERSSSALSRLWPIAVTTSDIPASIADSFVVVANRRQQLAEFTFLAMQLG